MISFLQKSLTKDLDFSKLFYGPDQTKALTLDYMICLAVAQLFFA